MSVDVQNSMTRINCIPVSELCDKHLVAEYRELPRISKLARIAPDAPTQYVLGAGHVKFFYDKGLYLQKRFAQLVNEMQRRGFTTNYTSYRPHPGQLNNDWEPDDQAIKLNRERIAERLRDMKWKP